MILIKIYHLLYFLIQCFFLNIIFLFKFNLSYFNFIFIYLSLGFKKNNQLRRIFRTLFTMFTFSLDYHHFFFFRFWNNADIFYHWIHFHKVFFISIVFATLDYFRKKKCNLTIIITLQNHKKRYKINYLKYN